MDINQKKVERLRMRRTKTKGGYIPEILSEVFELERGGGRLWLF